jgi:hypothetical protein
MELRKDSQPPVSLEVDEEQALFLAQQRARPAVRLELKFFFDAWEHEPFMVQVPFRRVAGVCVSPGLGSRNPAVFGVRGARLLFRVNQPCCPVAAP